MTIRSRGDNCRRTKVFAGRGLRRYALALAREEQQANELVQDCVERALKRWDFFEVGTNLRRWTLAIMHNLLFDDRRKTAPGDGSASSSDIEPLDFESAFYRLPKNYQEVMFLVSVEGLPYEEVATVTNISLGTVKSRLFLAREKLRELLDGGKCTGHRPTA